MEARKLLTTDENEKTEVTIWMDGFIRREREECGVLAVTVAS